MDTLPRTISTIEKEMTKNLTAPKDTEHSANSVDDEAYHRSDPDDRRCSQHC